MRMISLFGGLATVWIVITSFGLWAGMMEADRIRLDAATGPAHTCGTGVHISIWAAEQEVKLLYGPLSLIIFCSWWRIRGSWISRPFLM